MELFLIMEIFQIILWNYSKLRIFEGIEGATFEEFQRTNS